MVVSYNGLYQNLHCFPFLGVEIDKLENLWKCKGSRTWNTNLNNNELGRLVLLDIKNYRSSTIKAIWYEYKNKYTSRTDTYITWTLDLYQRGAMKQLGN